MDLVKQILDKKIKTIGIEGKSGAGKTTFAKALSERLDAFLLPIDLFHRQERKDWNLGTDISKFEDLEKVNEVIRRFKRGERFTLHSLFNHADGTFTRSLAVEPKEFLVVEGLFAMDVDVDFKIFLDIDPKVALVRGKDRDIRERNLTEEQWKIKKYLFHEEYTKLIPEQKKKADLVIDTTYKFPELKD
jgi:phosphoribulokinase